MKRTLIAASSMLAIGLAACEEGHQLDANEMLVARSGALELTQKYDADLTTVSPRDSDGDGYVTATLRGRKAPHEERDFLCGYKGTQPGCRPKPAK